MSRLRLAGTSRTMSKEPWSLPGLDQFSRIKFGPGVFGRTTMVAVPFVLVMGVAVWAVRSNPYLVFALVLLLIASLGAVFMRLMRYADANPLPSVLEGSDFVRAYEIEQGAKDATIIDAEAEPVQNPVALPNSNAGPNDGR